MSKAKKSVGLVILTEISRENGEKVLAVVLQRRGLWNMEKMRAESYPGCCQVTVHGKLEGKESFYDALYQESEEELGEKFARFLKIEGIRQIELVHKDTHGKEVITFGAFVSIEQLKMIRLAPESGGLDIVEQSEIEKENGLIKITNEMKKDGCPPSIRAMFHDEINAVKIAFKIVKKQ